MTDRRLKHKRRYCKVEDCQRIVKSQGVCQRHGAKPRKCKIVSCKKQAQGNFHGCCKAHFKKLQETGLPDDVSPEYYAAPLPPTQPSQAPILESREDHEASFPQELMTRPSIAMERTEASFDLWDEPFYCSNTTQSEELAADLFASFDRAALACQAWNSGDGDVPTHRRKPSMVGRNTNHSKSHVVEAAARTMASMDHFVHARSPSQIPISLQQASEVVMI
jgi:hypothetical protein